MCPYRDMYLDYEDIRSQNRFVQLGDENQRIPIHGIGTMAMSVQGHCIAYADVLHVPDLSAILLSSQVHQRIAAGCSLVSNFSGCFLTFPTFVIEIDDTEDCTIECYALRDSPHHYNFDSKSRIVALGNHETSIWEKADTFAPVL